MTHAKFGDDRLRGSGVVAGQISAFSIDFASRPYNTLTLPCERVICCFFWYSLLMALCSAVHFSGFSVGLCRTCRLVILPSPVDRSCFFINCDKNAVLVPKFAFVRE